MKYRELFEMARQRTDSYYMTHHVGDPDTEQSLAQLKANIRLHNQENPDRPKKVVLKGRLGVNSPHKDKQVEWTDSGGVKRSYPRYPNGLPTNNGGQWGRGWSHVPKADASRFDVYVRDKAPHEFGKGLADAKAAQERWNRGEY